MIELSCRSASHRYPVRIEAGLLASAPRCLKELAGAARVFVASDRTVWNLHGGPFAQAGFAHIEIPAGEAAKTWDEAGRLLDRLAGAGADRTSLLVALGGGAAGDLAGFAASVYMRGLRWVHVPTTLVAQVDACVGGKTGVDLARGKNLAGTFHPPRAVYADPDVLTTLSPDAFAQGLAEVVKYAVIADPELFTMLQSDAAKLLARDRTVLETIVARCLSIKIQVVEKDETEAGQRRILNFGHTFGHALEAASAYRVGHGQAVSIGMVLASRFSVHLELLDDKAFVDRLCSLLARLGLPVEADPGLLASARPYLSADKKARGGLSVFVLPERLGSVRISAVDPASLDAFLKGAAR